MRFTAEAQRVAEETQRKQFKPLRHLCDSLRLCGERFFFVR